MYNELYIYDKYRKMCILLIYAILRLTKSKTHIQLNKYNRKMKRKKKHFPPTNFLFNVDFLFIYLFTQKHYVLYIHIYMCVFM